MNTEIRSNQGYEIIEGCTIGSKEIVVGYHQKAPNPYVCWYCRDSNNYYQGCYCNTLAAAREKLIERYQSECQMPWTQYDNRQTAVRVKQERRYCNG